MRPLKTARFRPTASNEFFEQFPNCLAYADLDDCVVKLRHALGHKPQPLSDEHAYALSWEGATERLFHAGAITVDEQEEWERTGILAADRKAAKFHAEGARSSQFVTDLFRGKLLRGGGSGHGSSASLPALAN